MHRPTFFNNPRARWVQALRRHQSATDYACPVVIHTKRRLLPDWLVAIALVVVCAGIGVLLAWRG
jgi:hypothetical protein